MEDKVYRVSVSPKAHQMLIDHAAFLARINEAAALRLVEEFRKCAQSLSRSPERCSWLWEDMLPKHKYRKLIFAEKYLALFQVIDSEVLIEYVIDCRQDYAWLMAGK